MYRAGVHPTIAGVLLGLLTRGSADDPSAPLDRWEHLWRPFSAGGAVPLFALLSAGAVAPYPFAVALREDGAQAAAPSIGFPFALNVVDEPMTDHRRRAASRIHARMILRLR